MRECLRAWWWWWGDAERQSTRVKEFRSSRRKAVRHTDHGQQEARGGYAKKGEQFPRLLATRDETSTTVLRHGITGKHIETVSFFFASSRDCNRQRSPQHLPPSTQISQTTAQHSTWFQKTNRHMRHIALGYIKTNKQHRAQEYLAEKEAHRVLPASRARFLFLSFFSFLRSRHGTVYTTTYKTIGIVCLLKLDTNAPCILGRSGTYLVLVREVP